MIHASGNSPSCSIIFHAATIYPIQTTKIFAYLTILGSILAGLWYSLINTDFEFIPPILASSFLLIILIHAFLALFAIEKNNLFFMYFYVLILVLFQIFNCISLIFLLISKILEAFTSVEIEDTEDADIYKIDKYDQSLDQVELQVNVSFMQIFSVRNLILVNICFIIFGFWYLSVLNHCLNKMKALQKIKNASNNEVKEMLV